MKQIVRNPVQKRSIKKKENIIKAAFLLFKEKGYEAVGISEVAKNAEVSVGTIYSYFEDKQALFVETYESVFESMIHNYFSWIDELTYPMDISEFADRWLHSFLKMYGDSETAFVEFAKAANGNIEIAQHFYEKDAVFYSELSMKIGKLIEREALIEKLHTCYILADAYCQEIFFIRHTHLNPAVLKNTIVNSIIDILS